jgi:hypothetical protein
VQVIGNDAIELNTRNRQIDTLLELGDLPAADAALRALELSIKESTDARADGFVYLQRARHAIIEGHYAEAERLNAEAAKVALQVRDTNMQFLTQNQMAGLRWAQGRLDELEDEVRNTTATDTTPAWLAGLAYVSCAVGKEADGRRVFERMAVNDFGDLPRYNAWLVAIALLAETSIMLGDTRRAKTLYELLDPFADRILITSQAIYAGPVARFLGILAAALGEWDTATGHFAAARETAVRMNSPPVVMRVALDEAEMLAKRARPGDHDRAFTLLEEAQPIAAELGVERIAGRIEELRRELGGKAGAPAPEVVAAPDTDFAQLRREGDVWAFEYGPRSIAVRDSKGVRHIAFLLANPGLEVHALELVGADSGQAEGGRAGGAREDLHGIAGDDAGPVLDAQAKTAYRRRLEDLQEEIEEAEAFNDPERLARAREEFDFITGELSGAVGLGGRDRKSASGAERARVSVTKAIRSTIKRVTEHDPVLGRELDATIRTGTFCMYEPDPRHPLSWRVHQG